MTEIETGQKQCPACAEAIRAEALVCKHCGHDFRTGAASGQTRTNGFAIAAMVLGIVWMYGVGSILALIFGYKARREIDAAGGTQTGRGMATAGIVLGWIGVAGLILIIVLVIAVANECAQFGC